MVFGTLVGVSVFSVMWSELLITSAISCRLLTSVYECQRVECAFTSPVRTECGNVCEVMYSVLYVRLNYFVVRGCAVSRRYINVCYSDVFSVVNMYLDHLKFCVVCIDGRRNVCCSECDVMLSLMSVTSPPPALCNPSVHTVVKLCTLGPPSPPNCQGWYPFPLLSQVCSPCTSICSSVSIYYQIINVPGPWNKRACRGPAPITRLPSLFINQFLHHIKLLQPYDVCRHQPEPFYGPDCYIYEH